MLKKILFNTPFKWLLATLPASMAWGSVNVPLRLEWQTGYRNDTLHWHLQDPGDASNLTYSEHYRNLQFWENALSLRVIYRDLAFGVRGAYGAFGTGMLKQRLANLAYPAEQPRLAFDTDSWTADGWGYFGYAVNLTPDRTYKVVLIPLVGFGGNYERVQRNGTQTMAGPASVSGDTYSLASSFPSDLKMCWYGPLVGGYFLICPGGRLQFEAGYAYHWLHIRLTDKWAVDQSLFSGSTLLSELNAINKVKAKDGSNLEQSGWIRFDYLLSRVWHAGVAAQIQYFSSRVLNVTLRNGPYATPQKFKARWAAISCGATLSRSF